ncbi:MAG: hemolysin family protein [Anaerovoracaceae bacterium]|jgi:putative hemolysin
MEGSPDPSMSAAYMLVSIVILTIINGYFIAMEKAVETVNRNKIKLLAQEGNRKAVRLSDLLENPLKSSSAIGIIVTFAGFLASAIAAIGFSERIAFILDAYNIPYGRIIATVLITIVISFFFLAFGNNIPKRIAALHSERIALGGVRFLTLTSRILSPFIWLTSKTVGVFLKLFRQQHTAEEEFSEDEIMSMLEVGRETGVLKEEGRKMINSIFDFDDKIAKEVMTPRTDVFAIDLEDPPEEYTEELMELRYTRIPVYENDSDNIIGILNMKDYFIKAREKGFDNVNIREILRKPYFIPENKNIDDLFHDLQRSKQHIAILIDEYGGFTGIVTMEDLIEEVMGDIDDEYDEEEQSIVKIGENLYMIEGWATLDEMNEELEIKLESDSSETIGGYLIDILGEIPEEGKHEHQVIKVDNCEFTIESVKDRRIERIRLVLLPEDTSFSQEEEQAGIS